MRFGDCARSSQCRERAHVIAGSPLVIKEHGPTFCAPLRGLDHRCCEDKNHRVNQDVEIIRVPGKDTLGELYRRIADPPATGIWPIILGDSDGWETLEESYEMNTEDGYSEDAVIRGSQAIQVPAWLAKARQEMFGDEDFEEYSAEEGEWPVEAVAPMGIITHQEIGNGRPLPEVLIGLFPVDEPWKIFAKMAWGNWNACPRPEEHCAVHAYWGRKYGAQVVSITGDLVQCIVANPPRSREEAMSLAREQYAYCGDIVDQGCETLSVLAASLLGAKVWYFWWD